MTGKASDGVCPDCRGTGVFKVPEGHRACETCEGLGLEADLIEADGFPSYRVLPGRPAKTVENLEAATGPLGAEERAMVEATAEMLGKHLPVPVTPAPKVVPKAPPGPTTGEKLADILGSLGSRRGTPAERQERARTKAEDRLLKHGDAPVSAPPRPDPLALRSGETPEQREERIVAEVEAKLGRPVKVEERRGLTAILDARGDAAVKPPVPVPDWTQPYTLADLEKLAGTEVKLDDESEREEIDEQLTSGSPDRREEVAYNFFPHAPWWDGEQAALTPEERVAEREMRQQQEAYDRELKRRKLAARRRQTLVKKGFTTGLLGLGDEDQHDWARRVRMDDRPAAEIRKEIAEDKEIDGLTAGEEATDLFGKI